MIFLAGNLREVKSKERVKKFEQNSVNLMLIGINQ